MSCPSTWPFTRSATKSILSSGPPRFRFQPTSSPAHRAASMTRSRRNAMFACRVESETPATSRSGYFAAMQFTIAVPSLDAQEPPFPPPPLGGGVGDGAGAAGVRKVCVTLQVLDVSASPARARQKRLAPAASPGAWYCVRPPACSLIRAEATTLVNAWSDATWNSYERLLTGPTTEALLTMINGATDPATALFTG